MVTRLAFIALLLIAGCTTTKGTFCQIAQPVRLSASVVDQLSDDEVRQVLAHNKKGAALCKWQP